MFILIPRVLPFGACILDSYGEFNFCQNDYSAMCRLQKVDRTETVACVNGIYFSACNTELVLSFTTNSVPTILE